MSQAMNQSTGKGPLFSGPITIEKVQEVYRSGQASVRDVLEEVADRIAGSDPGIWTMRVPHEALMAKADAIDAAGGAGYGLRGVPYCVKDNIDVEGIPTTAGCAEFGYLPSRSSPLIDAMEAAGAILVGKNTMDQFATGLVGIRAPVFPANAYDDTRIPGGSSSGSAVAVKRGLVAFSLASDTGGSGRVPPAVNGIVGWKSSPEKVTTRGMVYANRSFDCVPVFANNLADALQVADLLPPRDAFETLLPAVPDAWLGGDPASAGIIGVPDMAGGHFIGDDDCRTAMGRAVAVAERAGYRVRPVNYTPLLELGRMIFQSALVAERSASIGAFVAANESLVDPAVRGIVSNAAKWSAADLFETLYELEERRARVMSALEGVELLMVPTVPGIPTVAEVREDPVELNHFMGTYTYFANLMGMAACALPSGMRSDGMPFSVSLLSAHDGEDRLRSVALKLADRLAAAD